MEEERMNTIKFCLKCGHPVGPEDKFCLGCGANIADMQAQQGMGAAQGDQSTQNTVNTQTTQNTQNTFQQPQAQPQQGAAFQPQQNNFYAAQPQAGFGAPGAAVKKGDNWFAKNAKLLIIIGVALVACIVGFFVIKHIFFRFQKIDAKDLIKVEFKGIDSAGVGTAKLNKYSDSTYGNLTDTLSDYVDFGDDDEDEDEDSDNAVSPYFEITEKKLLSAYTKASDKKEAQKMRDALLSESAGLKILINGEEGNAKGLKNGDKITIKLEYNEKYLEDNNIKIENAEYEVEAEGLKTGTKIDLFDGVKVVFSGNDGKGSASIDTSEAKSFIRYTLKEDYYKNLSNGGKVVVVARLRGATLVDSSDPKGAAWLEYDGNYYTADKANDEKEFTVEGLTEMKKVDVFENIKIEYRYAAPYLRLAKINTDNCSDEIKNGVRFYFDNSSNELKVGDTFKVKAYANNRFTNAGLVPEGTPDEEGYYVKEFTVGDDAPAYVTAAKFNDVADKFDTLFKAQEDQIAKDAVERTYFKGYSAGGTIESVTFKPVQTMLMTYNEAKYYNYGYVAKQYEVTVKTDKESKTIFGLILLKNPKIAEGAAAVDDSTDVHLYKDKESLDKALDNYTKNYTITKAGATKTEPTETQATSETTPDTTTTAEGETKPEETTTTKAA